MLEDGKRENYNIKKTDIRKTIKLKEKERRSFRCMRLLEKC